MRTFFKIKLSVFALLLAGSLAAQDAHKELLRGDRQYEDGNFSEAELNYRRALEAQQSAQGNYNLGNATYRQERYEEAVNHFQAAAESAPDAATKSEALHNLGNAYYQSGKFKESVEAYKNALRLNPDDEATRRNLSMAMRKLPPPQPNEENGQSQQSQDQQQDDQQQNQNQQQQEQEDKNDQQQQDEQNEGEGNQDQEQKQPQGQPQDLSKQEAARLLEVMDQEEQRVQEKLRKAQSKAKPQAKDW